jgi:uncharacterized SAM-binding protein YcdF (DUF218 family)
VLLKAGGVFSVLGILALVFAKSLLCIDSGPQQADVIILLGGGVFDRAPRAAELFKAGVARHIIVSGDGDCDENRLALILGGVPATAIESECKSTSTMENAKFTLPLLQAGGARRAIIVTSWYHSRRALNTFRAVAPQIDFVSMPAYRARHFPALTLGVKIFKEYVKNAWYCLRWGVSPINHPPSGATARFQPAKFAC